MKAIIGFVGILLISASIYAQREIDETRSIANSIDRLKIDGEWGNITLKKSQDNQLRLEGTAMINKGENDDAFEYSWEVKNNTLYFQADIPNLESLPKYVSYEKNGQKFYERISDGGSFDWKDIDLEDKDGYRQMNVGVLVDVDLVIYVPSSLFIDGSMGYGNMMLDGIGNDCTLKNTYGHILATFNRDNIPKQCTLKSTYSFVDVSLASDLQLDLSLETDYGEIYSDVNFVQDLDSSVDEMYHNKIVGTLNNGGNDLQLAATYNNIYLRNK